MAQTKPKLICPQCKGENCFRITGYGANCINCGFTYNNNKPLNLENIQFKK
jgi:rubredoxin